MLWVVGFVWLALGWGFLLGWMAGKAAAARRKPDPKPSNTNAELRAAEYWKSEQAA